MDCKNIRKILSKYIDNELVGVEKNSIFEHLQNCESCNKEYQSLKKVDNLLKQAIIIKPAADYREKILINLSVNEKNVENKWFINISGYLARVAVIAFLVVGISFSAIKYLETDVHNKQEQFALKRFFRLENFKQPTLEMPEIVMTAR